MQLFPAIIDLELSNRCNLDCVMCPRLPQKMHLGDMSRELLDRVLAEALEVPRRTFRLHGIGEPLLSPHFRYAVERIKRHPNEHRIDLITNGHLLDRDTTRFLLGQGVDKITVSVAAASPEVYRAVRKSLQFERVVQNTIRLIDERDRRCAPTRLEVPLVRTPPADREVEAFAEFWSRWDVQVEIWHDFNWGRRATGKPVDLSPRPCDELWEYTAICWDGRVSICCIDAARLHVVGNVAEHSLRAVYNGAALETIRRLHESGGVVPMPICADCSYRAGEHIAFSANPHKSGQRPTAMPAVPRLPIVSQ